jgi:polyhydroxyalkanoate synthesis repressor PhaR
MDKSETARRVTVKKYPNRRLYDTANSRYVNLNQIADLIKEGDTVEVIDISTGEDITKVILTQIILEEEKQQHDLLPTEFLHHIIQYGETAYQSFLDRFLSAGLSAYQTAQEHMGTFFKEWMKPWFPVPGDASRREIQELKAKIADLETRLREREPGEEGPKPDNKKGAGAP